MGKPKRNLECGSAQPSLFSFIVYSPKAGYFPCILKKLIDHSPRYMAWYVLIPDAKYIILGIFHFKKGFSSGFSLVKPRHGPTSWWLKDIMLMVESDG